MIVHEIRNVYISPDEAHALRSRIASTSALARVLRNCEEVMDVVRVMKAELSGQRRESYIERIYSRYRVLSRIEDTRYLYGQS